MSAVSSAWADTALWAGTRNASDPVRVPGGEADPVLPFPRFRPAAGASSLSARTHCSGTNRSERVCAFRRPSGLSASEPCPSRPVLTAEAPRRATLPHPFRTTGAPAPAPARLGAPGVPAPRPPAPLWPEGRRELERAVPEGPGRGRPSSERNARVGRRPAPPLPSGVRVPPTRSWPRAARLPSPGFRSPPRAAEPEPFLAVPAPAAPPRPSLLPEPLAPLRTVDPARCSGPALDPDEAGALPLRGDSDPGFSPVPARRGRGSPGLFFGTIGQVYRRVRLPEPRQRAPL